jgi:hypothetical protein
VSHALCCINFADVDLHMSTERIGSDALEWITSLPWCIQHDDIYVWYEVGSVMRFRDHLRDPEYSTLNTQYCLG